MYDLYNIYSMLNSLSIYTMQCISNFVSNILYDNMNKILFTIGSTGILMYIATSYITYRPYIDTILYSTVLKFIIFKHNYIDFYKLYNMYDSYVYQMLGRADGWKIFSGLYNLLVYNSDKLFYGSTTYNVDDDTVNIHGYLFYKSMLHFNFLRRLYKRNSYYESIYGKSTGYKKCLNDDDYRK